jgi:glutamate racemase
MKKAESGIGIFDSGIGGFSILHEIIRKAPPVAINYISDDAYAPYGEKTDSEIIQRSRMVTEMLLISGSSVVVVACNSATAAAISTLRKEYPEVPFVGVEPYINVLNHRDQFPGITKAAVITTELTGHSEKFRRLKNRIDPDGLVQHVITPGLATIVEKILDIGLNTNLRQQLHSELEPLRKLELSHLILGCTHYPLIAGLIEQELGVKTVSPAPNVAERVVDVFPAEGEGHCSSFNYLSTSSRNMEWEVKDTDYLDSLLRYSETGKDPQK